MDNLNTNKPSALYETFPPAEAKRIGEQFDSSSTVAKCIYLNENTIHYAAIVQTNALCSEPGQYLRYAGFTDAAGKHQPVFVGNILGNSQRGRSDVQNRLHGII